MGVRGLQSFAQNVPGGYRCVDLKQEARKDQRSNPILVVDLISFYFYASIYPLENLLGGRFNEFNQKMEDKLCSLKLMGYDLIFFVDGSMQPEKKGTVLRRREEEYLQGIKVLHEIDEGVALTEISVKIPSMKAYFENLIQIAKKYGDMHISALKECDQEIVNVANNKKALAVISSDTDFIIFDGPWRLWNGLNFTNNTAMEYDKIKIRESLNLSRSEMKLFASLAGNDIVSDELLQSFNHCYKWKFFKIAQKVREVYPLNDENIESLAKDIFEPEHYEEGLKALHKSIDFYSLEGMEIIFSDKIQEQVAQRSRFIYALLYRDAIVIPCTYCDLTQINYFDLYKPLLCRLMGVLFANGEKVNPMKIFYFRLNGQFEAVPLYAMFPRVRGKVPQLENLLLTRYGQDKVLDTIRWDLLCFIISSNKLKAIEVRSIPGTNRATSLALFYLVKANLITVDEADCILFACNGDRLPNLPYKFSFDTVRTIGGRDARVVFLFRRIMYEVPACFSAVGLQRFSGLITFDGLCYHNLRKIWRNLDITILESMKEKLRPFRIYA